MPPLDRPPFDARHPLKPTDPTDRRTPVRSPRVSRRALFEAFGTIDEQLEPLPEPGDFPELDDDGWFEP
jgi:hypothetical protein